MQKKFDGEIIELKLKFDRIYDRKKNRLIRSYQDIAKKIRWRNHGIKIKIWSNWLWLKKESFNSLSYIKKYCAYQDTVKKKIVRWRNKIKIKIWSNWLWLKKESFNSCLRYCKKKINEEVIELKLKFDRIYDWKKND